LRDFGDRSDVETQQLITKSSNGFSKSYAWAVVFGASMIMGGCGDEAPPAKTDAASQPATSAPSDSAAQKGKTKLRGAIEDERSAQERRRERLDAKKAD